MLQNSNRQLTILAIETSCDETAASVVRCIDEQITILSNTLSSQVELHTKWGGVVPNLAAREHLKNILPITTKALSEAHVSHEDIDLIAVTRGPGLIPALLMGTTTTKTLSYLWKKPLLGVHHIEGHIYANFIGEKHAMDFPMLALVVSGGHTQLVLMKDHHQYDIIGQTQDDAVGEAFDKTARMLGLGYPGGPAVSKAAQQHQDNNNRTIPALQLPRPMLKSKDLNFSFSGLKTAALYAIKKYRKENVIPEDSPLPNEFIELVSHEFQQAAIDVLVHKTLKATEAHAPQYVLLAGGVSANTQLREQLASALKEKAPHIQFILPGAGLSLDNAAMIAAAAYFRWIHMSDEDQKESYTSWKTLQAQANLSLSS